MTDDEKFGELIHALLRELGWSQGVLDWTTVHQALAQVRHLRKMAGGERDAIERETAEAIAAHIDSEAASGRFTLLTQANMASLAADIRAHAWKPAASRGGEDE